MVDNAVPDHEDAMTDAEYKLIVQADDYIATLRNRADGEMRGAPVWHGWALREAWFEGHRVGSLSFSTGVVHATPQRVWVDGVQFVRASFEDDLNHPEPDKAGLALASSGTGVRKEDSEPLHRFRP